MDLTREQALELHREMWTDMQEELGDCPDFGDRMRYKNRWCKKRFPKEEVNSDCFLCEYALQTVGGCIDCLINWGATTCQKHYSEGGVDWRYSPISEILALPERDGGETG